MSGWERIVGTASADDETDRTVVADCSPGKKALGGGWLITLASSSGEIVIYNSYPSDDDTWSVSGRLDATTGGDESYSLTAYVICATV